MIERPGFELAVQIEIARNSSARAVRVRGKVRNVSGEFVDGGVVRDPLRIINVKPCKTVGDAPVLGDVEGPVKANKASHLAGGIHDGDRGVLEVAADRDRCGPRADG